MVEGPIQCVHQFEELIGSLSARVCHHVLRIDPTGILAVFDQGEEVLRGEVLRYGSSLEHVIDDSIVSIR